MFRLRLGAWKKPKPAPHSAIGQAMSKTFAWLGRCASTTSPADIAVSPIAPRIAAGKRSASRPASGAATATATGHGVISKLGLRHCCIAPERKLEIKRQRDEGERLAGERADRRCDRERENSDTQQIDWDQRRGVLHGFAPDQRPAAGRNVSAPASSCPRPKAGRTLVFRSPRLAWPDGSAHRRR